MNRLADDALIVDPWVDKPVAPKARRGLGIAAVVVVCLGQAAAVTALGFLGLHYVNESKREPTHETAEAEPLKDQVEHKNDDEHGGVVHAPMVAPPPEVGPSGSVPQETERTEVGSVKVVELGYKVASLKQALASELATARAAGKDVLVMTTESNCDPCKGVIKSLSNDLMQRALAPVVLVRIDVEVFDKELDALHLQQRDKSGRATIPGFFLLGADGTPRDAINGGEWDEDIAENIAPVLGPFVRGEYDKKKRKSDWKKPMPQGVFL